MGLVPLGIVEGDALLEVGAGKDELSKPDEGIPKSTVTLQEECRILLAFGQGEELLCQLTCRLQVSSYLIKSPQTKQHWEDL